MSRWMATTLSRVGVVVVGMGDELSPARIAAASIDVQDTETQTYSEWDAVAWAVEDSLTTASEVEA